MGHHSLVAGVVDAGKISRDLARLAVCGGLLADLCRDSLQAATAPHSTVFKRVHAANAPTLTLGQGQALLATYSPGGIPRVRSARNISHAAQRRTRKPRC